MLLSQARLGVGFHLLAQARLGVGFHFLARARLGEGFHSLRQFNLFAFLLDLFLLLPLSAKPATRSSRHGAYLGRPRARARVCCLVGFARLEVLSLHPHSLELEAEGQYRPAQAATGVLNSDLGPLMAAVTIAMRSLIFLSSSEGICRSLIGSSITEDGEWRIENQRIELGLVNQVETLWQARLGWWQQPQARRRQHRRAHSCHVTHAQAGLSLGWSLAAVPPASPPHPGHVLV